MTDAYPRDCPVCGATKQRPSAFDLHVQRAHTDEEADRAVADTTLTELSEMETEDNQ